MGDISKGVANTLYPAKNIYKKKFESFSLRKNIFLSVDLEPAA